MRAIKIDSEKQTITEYENTGLDSLQEVVGGYIEIAFDYPDGSTCFVNDEGLFGNPQHFFTSKHGHQPYAGNAIIVGPTDDEGNDTECKLTLEEVKQTTQFLPLLAIQVMYSK